MKSHLLALFVFLAGFSLTLKAMEPAQLKLGGSQQEWYKGALARKLTDPVLLRYVYASRNQAGTAGNKIISIHPGTQFKPGVQNDYIFALVGSNSFNLFDEPYFSMELFAGDPKLSPKIVFRAPNNQVYILNFKKMSNYSATTPLYNAVLERITNTGANQQLKSTDAGKVLQALQGYINPETQVAKQPVDNLGHVAPGEVLTVLADDQDVYLSKGNK